MSESERQAVRCLVAGRVQGVYYRSTTAERARSLKLDGWVKNLPDGRVEVVACGAPPLVASLAGWLWRGPPAARVEAVYVEEWPEEVPAGFNVIR